MRTPLLVIVMVTCVAGEALAGPPGSRPTAFSFQGRLKDGGVPADGSYDFRFRLYDALTGGNQLGTDDEHLAVSVVDGLFTLFLNENNEFQDGIMTFDARYLEIAVRQSARGGDYISMEPRERTTSTPYAGTSGTVDSLMILPPPDNQAPVNVCVQAASAAAVFAKIDNLTSALDVVTAMTTGTGSALRATAASGAGILAESVSGIGLRATSTSGTALDVVGSSAFSGVAAFNNATTPFSVAGSGLVLNLNAERLGGQTQSYYRDASNLNAGTVADSLLSANVCRLDLVQTITGAKTFSAQTTLNARTVISSSHPAASLSVTSSGIGRAGEFIASGALPSLSATNSGAGRAGEFTGDLHTTGALTKAYTVGTANSAAPLAYGFVNSDGTLASATPNVSIVADAQGNGRVEIAISGVTYMEGQFATTVTPVFVNLSPVTVATTTVTPGGNLVVRTHALAGGAATDAAFQFVVFRP